MSKTKMSPCCAKYLAKLGADQSDLRHLARLAARPNPPRNIGERIQAARAQVANARQQILDHEGEHADVA